MSPELEKAIEAYPDLKTYLQSVPRQLWPIILPDHANDLPAFAHELDRWNHRESERRHIMRLQRQYNLPMRPNAAMRETMRLVRRARQSRRRRDGGDVRPD